MAADDPVDREFERRRRALQRKIAASGALLATDVEAIARACARHHPLLVLGGGAVAGACVARAATTPGATRRLLGRLVRVVTGVVRALT